MGHDSRYGRGHPAFNYPWYGRFVRPDVEIPPCPRRNGDQIPEPIETIEIAKRYCAVVFEFNWINDFAAARNYAIDKCNGEWILYIDADEYIDEFTINNMRQILQNSSENTGAYMLEILSHGLDENGKLFDYSGFYPRLFRNCGFPLIYFFGKIHEQIAPSIINLGLDIMPSNLKIIHEGYILNQKEMNEKVKNNLNILIQHIKDEPQNGYTWYQLGNTFFQMKDEKTAEELLINAVKCGNLSTFLQSNTYLVLATISLRKNNFEQAKYFAQESLNLYPKNNTGAKAILQKLSG